jgi:hypothetical protein
MFTKSFTPYYINIRFNIILSSTLTYFMTLRRVTQLLLL